MLDYKKKIVTVAEERNVWETVKCDMCGKVIYSRACSIPGLQVKKSKKKQSEKLDKQPKAEKKRKVKFFTLSMDDIDYHYSNPNEEISHFCSKECAILSFDWYVRSVWHRCDDSEYFAIRLSTEYVTEEKA